LKIKENHYNTRINKSKLDGEMKQRDGKKSRAVK
jgi:hypothetical protein